MYLARPLLTAVQLFVIVNVTVPCLQQWDRNSERWKVR